MTYLERIQKTNEQLAQADAEFRNEENRLQLESDLLATRKTIAQAKRELEELKGKNKLVYQDILDKQATIRSYEAALAELEELREELFTGS